MKIVNHEGDPARHLSKFRSNLDFIMSPLGFEILRPFVRFAR